MRTDIDIIGDDRVARMFDELGGKLEQPREAWRAIRPILAAGEREVFATRGASIGSPWAALRSATRRIKASRGQGFRPMVATGRLLKSLTTTRGAKQKWMPAKTQLTFGTQLFYARFVVDQRPAVGLSRATRRDVADELLEYVMEAVR